MNFKVDYIKVDDAIKIIEKAIANKEITRKAGEQIIDDIYHKANKNPWKTP